MESLIFLDTTIIICDRATEQNFEINDTAARIIILFTEDDAIIN